MSDRPGRRSPTPREKAFPKPITKKAAALRAGDRVLWPAAIEGWKVVEYASQATKNGVVQVFFGFADMETYTLDDDVVVGFEAS